MEEILNEVDCGKVEEQGREREGWQKCKGGRIKTEGKRN